MDTFRDRLKVCIETHLNPICLGIDPHFDEKMLPRFMRKEKSEKGEIALLEAFTNTLLDAAKGKLPAVKFQMAFFEACGWQGVKVLENAIVKAKDAGLLVILDAKRGDISSTMAAYGKMAFEKFCADALTVTPYMGYDVIQPLIPWLKAGKGVYIVWVSSNPSGSLLQDQYLQAADRTIAEFLLDALQNDFERDQITESIGLVLGATKLETLSESTWKLASNYPLLLPGIGPQGGTYSDKILTLLKHQTHLIPISRGIAGVGDVRVADKLNALTGWDDYHSLIVDNISPIAQYSKIKRFSDLL
ncbi:MAG: orotidine-5'-phosphate decarboxylase [Bdellovibrionota bacterium]